jgi:ribosomal protein L37AE/L43A
MDGAMSDKDGLVATLCPVCKKGVMARRTSDKAQCKHCGNAWAWKKARLVRAGRK